MKVWEALREAESRLPRRASSPSGGSAQGDSSEARLEAEVLLMHLTRWSRAALYTRWGEELPQEDALSLKSLIERRLRGEPVAYIVGRKEFYGLDFYVDQRVLIPRPETELLVETSLEFIEGRSRMGLPCRVADIGTGSGAIAVALAAHAPQAIIYATDISPEALEVAAINCKKHGVEGRVKLLLGDMLAPLPELVDLLVADLPYVKDLDLLIISGATTVWIGEPMVALDGGEDGLDKIRQLLGEAPSKLRPGSGIIMEIGWDQAQGVRQIAHERFPDAEIAVAKDLAGLDRMVSVMLPKDKGGM